MASGPSDRALEVARAEARVLMDDGARATVLTGSHARGEAHAESDLDIRGVGEERAKFLQRREEFLVSTAVNTESQVRKAFTDPDEVGEFVPGWRDAIILFDPDGLAAHFKKYASDWSWDEVVDADRWVGDEITSHAEEIHTLVGNIDQGQDTGAAAIRSQIVQGLAKLLSVHRRILYGSENDLWDLVGQEMGRSFAALQETAIGLADAGLSESCRATFELFDIVAKDTWKLLDPRQQQIVGYARKLSASRY